jgi:outer membrane protein
MKPSIFYIVFCFLLQAAITSLQAQSVNDTSAVNYSLKQCILFALDHNQDVQKSKLDIDKSRFNINESISKGLPQIEGYGNFQDFLDMPVTMIPGDFFGHPGTDYPMKLGSKYIINAGIKVNQLIYNQTFLTGIKLSKKQKEISELSSQLAQEDVIYDISKIYYLIQITQKQINILKNNLYNLDTIKTIKKLQFDNGIIRSVDLDRIDVKKENLLTTLDNTNALLLQQYNILKYTLGLPFDSKFSITDSLEYSIIIKDSVPLLNIDGLPNVKLLEKQKEITLLNKKVINSGYFPTFSAFGQFYYSGLDNEFNNFKKGKNWYGAEYIGLSLNIPIFDGFEKKAKASTAKIDFLKASLTYENAIQYNNVKYQNALKNFENYSITLDRQKKNIELAQKVYNLTIQRYHEGVSSLTDVLQDETSLSEAQVSYLNALFQYKIAKLDLLKSTGSLHTLIK